MAALCGLGMKPLRDLVLNCVSAEEVFHPVPLVEQVSLEWLERFQDCYVGFEC